MLTDFHKMFIDTGIQVPGLTLRTQSKFHVGTSMKLQLYMQDFNVTYK